MRPSESRLPFLETFLACLTLLRVVAAPPGCFTESHFISSCEPRLRADSGGLGIRGCFRPDMPRPTGTDVGESVVWNASSDVCERRPADCGGDFSGCPVASDSAGRCLVSCDVAERGFLVLSLRAGVGVKSFDLIDSPSRSNGSVRGASDSASLLPDVFRASALDQLPTVAPRLTFKEAVVRLYADNLTVLNLAFDLSASPNALNRTNWFSRDRLKSSWPVANLSSYSTNFFSIAGLTSVNQERRFYINFHFGGCPLDAGLLIALDISDMCPFAALNLTYPRFMYNVHPGMPFNTSKQLADYLVVIIR